jgi:hypothetical protein
MFLTKEELSILTGFKRSSKQCDQLRKQGVPFRVNAHGDPIVCRTAIEGFPNNSKEPVKEPWKPRLSA